MIPLDAEDIDRLKSVAGLMPLIAQYLKERNDARAKASADDFERWLKSDAIPLMEKQAAAIFNAVVTAKVENRERFDRLELLLGEIRDALVLAPGMRVWRTLSELERAMLTMAYEKAAETIAFDDAIECKDLASKLRVNTDDLHRAANLLHEHKFAQLHAFSGGYRAVRWLHRGVSLAWTALHHSERVAGERRLVAALPEGSHSARLLDLSERAAVSPGLTWVSLHEWEERGLLQIRRYDGARDHATIYNVTEKLRRELLA